MTMPLTDEQLLRYSRQIMLPAFDVAGQEALHNAAVLIAGLGGLGSAAALYLAASGVGHLVLADSDITDISNLQRQIIHNEASIGTAKAISAAAALGRLNSQCQLTPVTKRLAGKQLDTQVQQADLVLDCTDNFATRFALNLACLQHKRPLISAAAIRMEGQISVFDARNPGSPCYRCLYETAPEQEMSCAENGIMAPVVGLLGTTQAMEAIKLLADIGEALTGRLLTLDAAVMEWRCFKLPKNPKCPACATN